MPEAPRDEDVENHHDLLQVVDLCDRVDKQAQLTFEKRADPISDELSILGRNPRLQIDKQQLFRHSVNKVIMLVLIIERGISGRVELKEVLQQAPYLVVGGDHLVAAHRFLVGGEGGESGQFRDQASDLHSVDNVAVFVQA